MPEFTNTPGEDGAHITYCRLCEAQCGLIATVENGEITHIGPDREHVLSRGHLCVKGVAMREITYDDDRVLYPLKRTGGPGEFTRVTWDEALDDIAARLESVIQLHGGDAISSYIGNPAAFATLHYVYGNSFVRTLGGSKLYNAQHVDTGAHHAASHLVFGHSALIRFPDLPDCDFLLMLGANPSVSHMSFVSSPRSLDLLKEIHERDGVVVVDPRRTETAQRYEHQAVLPDSDAWLLIGILYVVIEKQLTDADSISTRIENWDAFAETIASFSLSEASRLCGVPEARIAELAHRFANAKSAACYGRVGTNRGRFSTLVNVLMDALNICTGNFGKKGGIVVGASIYQREGQRRRDTPFAPKRSRIGDMPIIHGSQPGGALADEILTPGDGQIRALFVDSGNPVMSYPDGSKLERALEDLDLLVGIDIYVNETNKFADYILPAPTFLERADVNDLGTTNAPEPWLQYVEAVVPPRGETRSEYDVYNAILERLGKPHLSEILLRGASKDRLNHMDVADNMLRAAKHGDHFGKKPDGINLNMLKEFHPHGYRFMERVDAQASWEQLPAGRDKALLMSKPIAGEFARLKTSAANDDTPQLKLFGRRLLQGLNSWMYNSDRLNRRINPTLLIHPEDARARQIKDGINVKIESAHGEIQAVAELSEDVIKGSVNYPHGFGHAAGWRKANDIRAGNVNLLASSEPEDWEPISGVCLLDGIPVEVSPLAAG